MDTAFNDFSIFSPFLCLCNSVTESVADLSAMGPMYDVKVYKLLPDLAEHGQNFADTSGLVYHDQARKKR